MIHRRLIIALSLFATAAPATLISAAIPETASGHDPSALTGAQAIRAEIDARYRRASGQALAVTEATSSDVLESFALLTPDLLGMRFLPADNGIWYAICPVGASCPYPARRLARPAVDLSPRRLAVELALRTFIETSADLVAVSLPTPRFIALVVEREELAREVDVPALANALSGDPARTLSASLQAVVNRVTRPRVFVALGLEPAPSGRDSWVGCPRWLGKGS